MTNNNNVKVMPASERNGAKFIPLINAIIDDIEEQFNKLDRPSAPVFSTTVDYVSISYLAKPLGFPSSWDYTTDFPECVLKEVCNTFRRNGYDTEIHYHFDTKGTYYFDFIEVALPGRLMCSNIGTFDGTYYDYMDSTCYDYMDIHCEDDEEVF